MFNSINKILTVLNIVHFEEEVTFFSLILPQVRVNYFTPSSPGVQYSVNEDVLWLR